MRLLFSLNLLVIILSAVLLGRIIHAIDEAEVIPDHYIVFYKKDADRTATNQRLFFSSGIASSESFHVVHELERGIAVAGITDEQYQELVRDKAVEKVIPDYRITLATTVQSNPPSWGLDRIDQTKLPLNKRYEYNYDGTGVKVYVIDTGIRATHNQFGGRVTCGINLVRSGCGDTQGHGTHVAGTIGGVTVGVAKNVELVDVNVFGSMGSAAFSTVIVALEYVKAQKTNNPSTPMVINMSLGSSVVIQEFKQAIDAAVAAGIVVVVAAGNNATDSCSFSPAFVANAITVGSSDRNDRRAVTSNYGPCVDLYAPGVDIYSTFIRSDTSVEVLSGTSMAAPHVAGAAALYLQAHPAWTPAQVWNAMQKDATEAIKRRRILRFFSRYKRTTRLVLQTQYI